MSRRPIGSRVLWGADKAKAQRLDAAVREMYVPVDPERELLVERTPLTAYAPAYEWCDGAFRYRWRKGTVRKGKDVSYLFCPVPDAEEKRYAERLARRRQYREHSKGGSRLKKRPRA